MRERNPHKHVWVLCGVLGQVRAFKSKQGGEKRIKMPTKGEKECMELFQYGYFDTVLSGRCGIPIAKVQELRTMYNLLKGKKEV